MGFSLVGNSGDTSSTTNVNNYSADSNPQLEAGSAPGDFLINLSPINEGSGSTTLNPDIENYYAPLAVTSTGDNLGDSALAALSSLVSANASANTPGTVTTASTTSLSSTTIYLALAAVVLLFLAHE